MFLCVLFALFVFPPFFSLCKGGKRERERRRATAEGEERGGRKEVGVAGVASVVVELGHFFSFLSLLVAALADAPPAQPNGIPLR